MWHSAFVKWVIDPKFEYKGEKHTGRLEKGKENGNIMIKLYDDIYNSPSKAIKAITNKNTNGWTEWKVYNNDDVCRGSLADLRGEFDSGNPTVRGRDTV